MGGELAADQRPRRPGAGAPPTVAEAAHAMLAQHRIDWSTTTLKNAEHYLLKGRWPEYLAHHGIVYIDQLTAIDSVHRTDAVNCPAPHRTPTTAP